MIRFLSFVYGVATYLIFLATFICAIGFVGGIVLPQSLDGPATGSWPRSLAIDLGLLSLFALQHSGMARLSFKKRITQLINPAIERTTFVLASSIALGTLIAFWQPLGGVVWSVENSAARAVLYVGFACGWGVVLFTTFLINHFELFGLQQVWRNLRGLRPASPAFVTPLLYRIVRHPLYAGFLLAFFGSGNLSSDVRSDPGQHSAQQGFELAADFFSRLHDLLVREDLVRDAGRHIRHARNRQHLDSHVPCGDDFGDG